MRLVNWRLLNNLIFFVFISVSMVSPAAGSPAAGTPAAGMPAAGISAHETVQNATDLLLEKFSEIKHLYTQDPLIFFNEVDSVMAPFIDFDKFSRGVMAKYYKRATPAQRQRFQLEFKDDLIKTYAKALIEFDNERISILPAGETKPKRGNKTIVKMEVHSKSGTIFPVDYTTTLINGQWKLINVRVNGINLGMAFRDKFRDAMATNKGDIGQVIDSWNSKVVSKK